MTKNEKNLIGKALRMQWEYIGHDIMQACEAEGKDSIPRSHVVEVVLDTFNEGHQILHRFSGAEREILSVLVEQFSKLAYSTKVKIATEQFPFKRYA